MSTAVFGAPEFRARSGRLVLNREDGSVAFHLGNGYLGADVVMDAEEFFQAKRDAELGRWRWPANPQWIVYPRRPGFVPYGDADLLVINEVDGSAMEYVATDDDGTCYTGREEPAAEAARAYFEAHPARKPWEDAKAGDVWVIEVEGVESYAVHVVAEFFGAVSFQTPTGRKVDMNNSAFTGFRKIWPEDAS